MRLGDYLANDIPVINAGSTYEFCVWLRFVSGYTTGDSFEMDIVDRVY